MKKPWLSALLNLLLPGVGYLYNGRRLAFGMLILFSSLLTFGVSISNSIVQEVASNIPVMLAALIEWTAFIVDGYLEAKEINSKK